MNNHFYFTKEKQKKKLEIITRVKTLHENGARVNILHKLIVIVLNNNVSYSYNIFERLWQKDIPGTPRAEV